MRGSDYKWYRESAKIIEFTEDFCDRVINLM